MLDKRKRLVLRAIIDDYVKSAEPVGSRTIARKHNLGVSPATIRNEMADLEDTGYLQQPHVSAGRIPSDKGYRFYVDVMMEPLSFSQEEYRKVYGEMAAYYREMERLIQEACNMLALLTQSTSIVVAPPIGHLAFQHIQLIPVDGKDVLVVLILHPGVVKNKMIRTERTYTNDELNEISASLNQKLKGVTYREVGSTVVHEITTEFGEVGRVLVELIVNGLTAEKNEQVYSSGTTHILNQPEFRDIDRVKALFEMLDQKDIWLGLLGKLSTVSGVHVAIGSENSHAQIQDCSLVTATYHLGNEVMGTIGVIGPTRMEYARVVSMVDLIAESLSEILSDLN